MYFLFNYCGELGPIIRLLKSVFTLLQWGIPIVLILFGAIDLGKAVMASKEDEMKKAQGTLIKRVVYAVLIFFLFTIVTLVISMVSDSRNGDNQDVNNVEIDWAKCWTES